MIILLAGGVGGARLAAGFARILAPNDVLIAVNTGDDFTHLGLHICPDLDTVMYTLAGVNNPETGWGIAGETWHFMEAMARLGGETWFRLGDRDLATHVERTRRLNSGETLSAVATALCKAFDISQQIVPMTDHIVRTVVHTDEGALPFQDYFVRRRCEPKVRKIEIAGASEAVPSPALSAALTSPTLRGIVICPSNPYLSIEPILSVPGVREALQRRTVPAVAVSPLIGGRAVKGPAAKIMEEMGHTPSVIEIGRFYHGLIDGIVIDNQDQHLAAELENLGLRVSVTDSLMKSAQDQERLAAAGSILR